MPLKDTFQTAFMRKHDVIAMAPGRLEFMGNHTDYNGGRVLGVAVDRGIQVAVAKRSDREVNLHSAKAPSPAHSCIDKLGPQKSPHDWANYALGPFDQLIKAGMKADKGFDMAVESDLSAGAGMSSSAAFELAAGMALGALYDFQLSTADWARLARRAENDFVGVPCGILDQGVSAFGKRNHLVHIDCETEEFKRIPIPNGLHFWVFNSGVKHALLDSLYDTRYRECMEAASILSESLPSRKHLAAFSPDDVEKHKQALGKVLYNRALHVTQETKRVSQIEAALSEGDLTGAGKLLIASHNSSRDLFENSCPELDKLVALLREVPEVYGCRLTGGGFGGAVMAVTSEQFALKQAEQVAAAYAKSYDHRSSIIHTQSGEGAHVIS